MIPLKLQLKNFLSYGSDIQTIDFSAYPLICLSGKNGHGKSALLDAITWALWGQGRKTTGTSKADQGLLRLGQTQMMVCLDFELNGQTYRVRREFAKTHGKAYAALDFGLLDLATDALIPLTNKTIRGTQATIEKTLNLSYNSFTNSAFLRQGQSNEFSKKSPKDRKEILANILSLNQYEDIRKLAMEKARQANAEKTSLHGIQEKIEQELAGNSELTKNITEVANSLTTCAQEASTLAQEKTSLEKEKTNHTEQQQQYKLITFKLKQYEEEQTRQQKQLSSVQTQWSNVHKKLLTLDHKALEQEKATCVTLIQQHQAKLQKGLQNKEAYLKHKEELQNIEQEITKQHTTDLQQKNLVIERITAEHKAATQQLEKLAQQHTDAQKEHVAHTQEIIEIEKQASICPEQEKQHTRLTQQFERRKEYYQKFIAQGNHLKTELNALQQKKQLTHDENDPSCPLCEQNLSASRRRFLQTKFENQQNFLQHRFARMARVIKNLKAILFEQHAQLETLRKAREERSKTLASLEEKKKSIQQRATIIAELKTQCTAYEKQISNYIKELESAQKERDVLDKQKSQLFQNHANYQQLAQNIQALIKKTKELSYDAQRHEADTKKLQIIEKQLAEQTQLLKDSALQEQRKKEVSQLCILLKKLKQMISQLHKERIDYKNLEATTIAIDKKTIDLEEKIKALHTKKEELLQTKGKLETHKENIVKLEKEHKEQQKKIKELIHTIDDYQNIATATGKNGIQALLIEEAIPEIEQEANRILAKLTNNQAQIFIESLRDLKKGGTKETLDIKISDAVGIRAYELFSGGEAFRIDFALRIAISKLLARRAGTSLQTLIIDEGFGSQDEEGLSNIMDAIYKIQDDFSKVIVVSHLASMQDQFPVHFVVEKGPNGSRVQVLEQG